MSDKKISQLAAASTPLAGTEVLPIVQSNSTVKVTTNDLTVKNVRSNATTGILQIVGPAASATRTMTVPDANFTIARIDAAQSFSGDQTFGTGNVVIGTAGKGVDFSANTHAAGMTSEKLTWYEEGTWTPTLTPASGSLTTYTSEGYYTRVGRSVTVRAGFKLVDVGTAAGLANFGGLPFTSMTMSDGGPAATGVCSERFALGHMFQCWVNSNATTGTFATTVNGAPPWTNTYLYVLSMTYQVA